MEPGKAVFEGKTAKGTAVLIRYPKAEDLEDLLSYINTLSSEQTYISLQGVQLTLEEEKKFLDEVLKNLAKNEDIHLLTFSDDKLVAVANVSVKEKVNRHVAVFGISVARNYRNHGIGELLTEKILEEAKKNLVALKIITLEVFANNKVAIELYTKIGFKKYGLLPKGVRWRDTLVDKLLMYKNLTRGLDNR